MDVLVAGLVEHLEDVRVVLGELGPEEIVEEKRSRRVRREQADQGVVVVGVGVGDEIWSARAAAAGKNGARMVR